MTTEAPNPADRQTCRECGGEFAIKPGERAFYAAKELCLPKRCPPCRAKHRELFGVDEQLRGVVELANDQFGFISCEDGRTFFYLARAVTPHDLPLRPGDPVFFTADRQPPWRPGRRPNARTVRRRDPLDAATRRSDAKE